jgi:hypothetical protein
MEHDSKIKTFRYPELSRSAPAIRLMTFTSVGDDAFLEYAPESFELDSFPPFTALSYTWGSLFLVEDVSLGTYQSAIWDEPNYLAICNQQSIHLRKNLYEALQTLRQGEDRCVYLWVDDICINQMDDDERTSQVGLMSDIYGRADMVIAWLGPELECLEKAHALLYNFGTGIMEMIMRDS